MLLPLLTIAALALVQPEEANRVSGPPTRTPLSGASVICPSTMAGAGPDASVTKKGKKKPVDTSMGDSVVLTAVADPSSGGELAIRSGDQEARTVPLAAGAVVQTSGQVVTGTGPLATGLTAILTTEPDAASAQRNRAGVTCLGPQPEQWFTGVGAGAEHRSVLELTNPDDGTAVADVAVFGDGGPLSVPALRGLSVPGHGTTRVDLTEVVPERKDLALQVLVSRGRLGVAVADRLAPLGTTVSTTDWLAAQARPATTVRLLGLGSSAQQRLLTVANPGTDQTRVSVQVMTARSEFAPAGLDELDVPPGSVRQVDLTEVLDSKAAKGALGLRVSAARPITAGLSGLSDRDLVQAASVQSLGGDTGSPLPRGVKRLLLAGATKDGTLTVHLRTAQGRELDPLDALVAPGEVAVLELPDRAAWLEFDPVDTGVGGIVELSSRRLAHLQLAPLVLDNLVPAVRPALH